MSSIYKDLKKLGIDEKTAQKLDAKHNILLKRKYMTRRSFYNTHHTYMFFMYDDFLKYVNLKFSLTLTMFKILSYGFYLSSKVKHDFDNNMLMYVFDLPESNKQYFPGLVKNGWLVKIRNNRYKVTKQTIRMFARLDVKYNQLLKEFNHDVKDKKYTYKYKDYLFLDW